MIVIGSGEYEGLITSSNEHSLSVWRRVGFDDVIMIIRYSPFEVLIQGRVYDKATKRVLELMPELENHVGEIDGSPLFPLYEKINNLISSEFYPYITKLVDEKI